MKKWYLLSLMALAADRLSKLWAQNQLSARGSQPLWPGVAGFVYARNTGMAFSLGSQGGWLVTLITAALVAVVALVHLKGKDLPSLSRGALALVLAGGLGNLTDRLMYGYVVDFIHLEFIRFAIFNVADVAICAGAALAAIGLLKDGMDKKRSPGAHKSEEGS